MSLRVQAAADLLIILQDPTTGFGWPITLVSPDGKTATFVGFSTDIGVTLDPETGVFVSGRKASVALSIEALKQAGFGIPRAIADRNLKPWLVRFDDIHGKSQLFKVSEANPDTAIGCVTCLLEAYRG